jgi:hypothetical protein
MEHKEKLEQRHYMVRYHVMSLSRCRHLEAELNANTRVQQVPLDTDPLMWWKQHVQEFPHLARMARQYLTVPATSASPERLFSSVELVHTHTLTLPKLTDYQ